LRKILFFDSFLAEKRTQKNLKKGLKKGAWWFTMVSSGRKWRVVVQNGEDIPVLEEGELHVERRIQS